MIKFIGDGDNYNWRAVVFGRSAIVKALPGLDYRGKE